MNRKRIVCVVLGIIFFTLIFVFVKNESKKATLGATNKKANEEQQLSKKEEEKLIKENTEKYQPRRTTKTKENTLDLSAKSAIVVDQGTNEIIYAQNIETQLPPASIAKILTFSIALEKFNEEDLIEISQRASEQISNKINMKPGEKLRVSDLLYGLMMISANDAAYAIADASEGGFEKFMADINKKIYLLGLKNSVIKSPAGLDEEGQFSTVFDIATMTRYALLKHPSVIQYAGKTKEHSVQMSENNEPHWWFGHLSAMLKRYPGMIAAKTGYTDEARSTYIGIAERNGRQLVVVLMGSDDANNDVPKLLDFGFSN